MNTYDDLRKAAEGAFTAQHDLRMPPEEKDSILAAYRHLTRPSEMLKFLDDLDAARVDAKTGKEFADLWYFAMDEAPREFEEIVAKHSPAHWMGEIAKIKAAKPSTS